MENLPDIPGDYVLLYQVDIADFEEFQRVKARLTRLQGVEDVLLHQKTSAYRLILLTNGLVTDAEVKTCLQDMGYRGSAEKLSLR